MSPSPSSPEGEPVPLGSNWLRFPTQVFKSSDLSRIVSGAEQPMHFEAEGDGDERPEKVAGGGVRDK